MQASILLVKFLPPLHFSNNLMVVAEAADSARFSQIPRINYLMVGDDCESQPKCEVMTSASIKDRIEKVITSSIPRRSVSVFQMIK